MNDYISIKINEKSILNVILWIKNMKKKMKIWVQKYQERRVDNYESGRERRGKVYLDGVSKFCFLNDDTKEIVIYIHSTLAAKKWENIRTFVGSKNYKREVAIKQTDTHIHTR